MEPKIQMKVTASSSMASEVTSSSKSRMITFRLTAEEYQKCREVCYARGIRSVSGMVRAALNLLIQQPERANPQVLESRVSDLEGRLHILLLELKRLNGGSSPQRASEPETLASSATQR